MAGIGFELKKLLIGRGIIQKTRAYAYASIVCTGTMILAVVLLIGMEYLAKLFGASTRESEMMVVLMVYALLFSLLLTSGMIMLLSRYVADMLYNHRHDRVMPSLYGGSIILMIPGGAIYGVMLWLSPGIPLPYRLLSWGLFVELIPVWLQMAYITAVKDYKRVLFGFAAGVASALGLGFLLAHLGVNVIVALLTAVFVGYGVMALCFTSVLHSYFKLGVGSVFHFLGWVSKYPSLLITGFLSMLGAFIHLMIMWSSPLGRQVEGVFFHAPEHDVAAFYAFLVSLPTSVNFVMSIEVNFYDKYRKYFGAITEGGSLNEIELARGEMNAVLRQELFQLMQVQTFCLIIYVVLATPYLESIGFTRSSLAMFRVMCVGYSAYAIGNSLLLLLYFDDRRDALITTACFALTNLVVTLLTRNGNEAYYGIGLLSGGCVMYLVGLALLMNYMRDVDFHVYCGQPLLARRDVHWLERVSNWLDAHAYRIARRQLDESMFIIHYDSDEWRHREEL